jgi:hypothetical protein
VIPLYTFFILKRKLGIADAGPLPRPTARSAPLPFITASSFLESNQQTFGGHMVAVMAFMEAPAIVIGVFLMMRYDKENCANLSFRKLLAHAFTNGSVFLILGSLLIGFLADPRQAEGLRPFAVDLFKGFLAIFLWRWAW